MTFDIGHNENPKKNWKKMFIESYVFLEKLNNKKNFWPIFTKKFYPFSSVGFVYEFSNCFGLNMPFDIGHNENPKKNIFFWKKCS